MAHETELRQRPDPARGVLRPFARPAGGAGIVLLRDCASDIEEVHVPLAVLDPRRGVVLVAAGPPGMLPALEGALRRRLAQARFGAVFPGHLPVVVLPAEAWDRTPGAATSLTARLERAFAGMPPLSLPPGGAWVPSVARLLQSPPAPQQPQRSAVRARRRRGTARIRWLAGGLGLGLLLIGGIAGLSERGGVVLTDAPMRADGALSRDSAWDQATLPERPDAGVADREGPVGRPGHGDSAPQPPPHSVVHAEAGAPVEAGRRDSASRSRDAQPGTETDRTGAGAAAGTARQDAGAAAGTARQDAGAAAGRASQDAGAAAAVERQQREARAAAERRESEIRAAADRQQAEARAAAERREAERAARRAAAIDAALRAEAEAARRRQQEEAEVLRRDEAAAALRARQEAEATLQAQQQERCQRILHLLRAGGFPAEADLAFFDRRCMPG